MPMIIRANRDVPLEEAGKTSLFEAHSPAPDRRYRATIDAGYFALNIAVRVKWAGSNTASKGGPRPVSGIEFN